MYGRTPELALADAVPSHKPLQLTGVLVIVAVTPGVFSTFTHMLSKQPFMSVTVTQYYPGIRSIAVAVICPFDHK